MRFRAPRPAAPAGVPTYYQALAALQSVTATAAVDAGGCVTVVVTLFSHAVVLLELSLGWRAVE
jgi:hypothetical protein